MGFSSSLFPFFRDVNGQPLTSRDKWGYPPSNKARYKGNSALAMLLEDCLSLKRLVLRKNLLLYHVRARLAALPSERTRLHLGALCAC